MAGRLGHAPLLIGPRGMGKLIFARRLATLLLCQSPAEPGHECGACAGCRLHRAGNHPDYVEMTVADGKTQITVDQVRELSRHLALKSHAGGNKVALLSPAEKMNVNAANSLLKTLEEPPVGTTLILSCSSISALPATVRSRCQKVPFSPPDPDTALEWLRTTDSEATEADWRRLLTAADGAPLGALALHQDGYIEAADRWEEQLTGVIERTADPVAVAAKWAREDPAQVLGWLKRRVETAVCLNSGALDVNQVEETRFGRLQNVMVNLNIVKLMEYLDWLRWLTDRIERPLNLQLAFESALIPWSQELRIAPRRPAAAR